MICPKCNQNTADGSKFCEHCGAKIEEQTTGQQSPEVTAQESIPQGTQQIAPQEVPQEGIPQGIPQGASQQFTPVQPRKPVSKGLIIGIAAAVVVIIAAIILFATHKKKIDLADYTEVTFSGYDSYGKATIEFDEEALLDDLAQSAKNVKKPAKASGDDYDWSDLASDLDGLTGYWELCEGLEWTLDKDFNLSNGDEVTVSFQFDNDTAKKYGIKFVGKDKTYTVSGLAEVREVDPFEDITVSFSGTAPNVYAEIENNSADEAVKNLYFTLDKSSGISKGDTVVVTVDYDEDYLLENYGCMLTSTSKEYTCDAVDAYIMDGSEVGEDVLGQMKEQAEDTIDAYFAQNSDYISVKDLNYVGYYFLAAKDEDTWGRKNIVYIVYSGTVSSREEDGFKKSTVYFPVYFGDVIKYADGTDYVDLSSADIEGSTDLEFDWWSTVSGYEKISNMKNELVTSKKDEYKDSAFGDLE